MIVPYAGLVAPDAIDVAADVRLEMVFEANLSAEMLRIARDVQLGFPDPNTFAPPQPVYGLKYRVRGFNILESPQDKMSAHSASNYHAIAEVQTAFERAVSLMRNTRLIRAGEFVAIVNRNDVRSASTWQFSAASLGAGYAAVHLGTVDAPELQALVDLLRRPYFDKEGRSIATALARFGSALSRDNPIDVNLDLCIAAEILFGFGIKRTKNEEIAKRTECNAAAFFGNGEFFWDRATIADVVNKSYKERSDTVHGREGLSADRASALIGLNVRLREIVKAALTIYVRTQPKRATVRHLWGERAEVAEAGGVLSPVIDALKA